MSVLFQDDGQSTSTSPAFTCSPSPCPLPTPAVPQLSFPFVENGYIPDDEKSPPSCKREAIRQDSAPGPNVGDPDEVAKKKISFSLSSPPIFTRARNGSCPSMPPSRVLHHHLPSTTSTPPPKLKKSRISPPPPKTTPLSYEAQPPSPAPRASSFTRSSESHPKTPDLETSSSPRDGTNHKWLLKVGRTRSDSLRSFRRRKSCALKKSPHMLGSSEFSPRPRLPSDAEFLTLEEIILRLINEQHETETEPSLLFYLTSLFFATSAEVVGCIRSVVLKNPELCEKALAFVFKWVSGDYASSSDLLGSEPASSSLEEWLSGLDAQKCRAEVKKIRDCLKQKSNKTKPSKGKQNLQEETDPLPFIHMKSLKWAGYNEEWLAATLTLHEFSLFSAIPLSDFVYHVLKGEGKEEGPLFAAISFFNSLSHWVTLTLVKEPYLKTRIEYLSKIIRIADHLMNLNNFSGSMAILAGLNNFSVSRMKQTWKGIEPDLLEKYNSLETLMCHTHNYSTYRAALKACTGPCVPYLGLILSDITFMETGNQAAEEGKINFSKWQMIGSQLENISTFQKNPFLSLEGIPQLLLFIPALSTFEEIDDDECEWYSKMMEPADPEAAISHLVEELLDAKRQNEILQKKLEAAT